MSSDHEPWKEDAACVDTDPDLFFPSDIFNPDKAAEICGACPVRRDCYLAAVRHREPCGVWGGVLFTTKRQRQLLLGHTQ